jgi:hypothetical protein
MKQRTTLSNVKIDTKGKPVKEKPVKKLKLIKKETKLDKALDVIAEEKPVKREKESKKFELIVNNKYLIKSDGACVSVFQKTRTEKGIVLEKSIGHFSNLEQALNRLLEEKIADLSRTRIEEMKGHLFTIYQDLKNAITELSQKL